MTVDVVSQAYPGRALIPAPGPKEAHQRNLRRSGADPGRGYIDEGIRIVYAQLGAAVPGLVQDGWIVVDSTALSLEQTVATILQRMAGNR